MSGCIESGGVHESTLEDADRQPLLHENAVHLQVGGGIVMRFRAESSLNKLNRHRVSGYKYLARAAGATRGQQQLVNSGDGSGVLCPVETHRVGPYKAPSVACHDDGVGKILNWIDGDNVPEAPSDVSTISICDKFDRRHMPWQHHTLNLRHVVNLHWLGRASLPKVTVTGALRL